MLASLFVGVHQSKKSYSNTTTSHQPTVTAGYLKETDIMAAFRRLDLGLTTEQIHEFLRDVKFDKSMDGTISYTEFAQALHGEATVAEHALGNRDFLSLLTTSEHEEVVAGAWEPSDFFPVGALKSQSPTYHQSPLREAKRSPERLAKTYKDDLLQGSLDLQKAMELEIQSARDSIKRATEDLDHEREKRIQLERMLEEQKEELRKALTELQSCKLKQDTSEMAQASLESVIFKLEQDASASRLTVESLKLQLDQQHSVISAHDNENARYEGRIEELERKVRLQNEDVQRLTADLDICGENEKRWVETKIALESTVETLQDRVKEAMAQRQEDQELLRKMREEEESIILLVRESLQLDDRYGESPDVIPYVHLLLKSFEKAKHGWKKEREGMEAKIQYMETTTGRLKEAKSTIDEHLQKFEKTSKVMRKRLSELELANSRLTDDLARKENEFREQSRQIEALRKAAEHEKADRSEAREAIEAAMLKSSSRIVECKALYEKVGELEKKLEKAVQQNRSLLEQLQDMSVAVKSSQQQVNLMKLERQSYIQREQELRQSVSLKLADLKVAGKRLDNSWDDKHHFAAEIGEEDTSIGSLESAMV